MDFDKEGNLVFFDKEPQTTEVEVKQKPPRLDIFQDILTNIVQGKEDLDWALAEKPYEMFLINRCILQYDLSLACLLNEVGSKIDKKTHYKLLRKIIQPKKKRFLKYLKPPLPEKDVELMAVFFNASVAEIMYCMELLSDENIKYITKEIKELDESPEKKKTKK